MSGKLDVLLVIGGIVASARSRASTLSKDGSPEERAEAHRQVNQAIALEKRVRMLMDASKGVLSQAKSNAPENAWIEISQEAISYLRSAYGRAKS